jgi:hypothetical protein
VLRIPPQVTRSGRYAPKKNDPPIKLKGSTLLELIQNAIAKNIKGTAAQDCAALFICTARARSLFILPSGECRQVWRVA